MLQYIYQKTSYEAGAGECAATTIPEKEIYPRIIICCAEC